MIKSTPVLIPFFQIYYKALKRGMFLSAVRCEDGYALRFGYTRGVHDGSWAGIFETHLDGLNSTNRIYRNER